MAKKNEITLSDFDELIMFRKPYRDKSSKGQVKETWTDYRKALVSIDQSGNVEKKEGKRMNLPGSLSIAGHYDSGVDTTFRILWNSEEYNILSITPDQHRRYMEITAEKVFE